jgi:cell wall-associated NlpC family hydrolase
MGRITSMALAVVLATGVAGAVSLPNASAALEGAPDQAPTGGADAVDPDPYFQVVDDATEGRFVAPGWEEHSADPQTFGGTYATADSSAGAASFRVKIPGDDYYSVYARWPTGSDNASTVRFGVPTASGAASDEVDQGVDGGFWVRIGAYEMEKGERVLQVGGSAGGEGRVVADAVMVVRDVLVGRDGRTASYANPDELAPALSNGAPASVEPAFSAANHRNPNGADVLRVAKRHLGTRYGYDRCRINVQEDCSCLTRLAYRHFGKKLPDSPVYQWRTKKGRKIYKKANIGRGDLIFHDLNRDGLNDHFKDHVGIWAGNGNMVHASSYFGRVVISEERYLKGFRGGKSFRLR